MGRRILAATRKGLFSIDKSAGKWRIANAQFLGDTLSLVGVDPRDGTVYAAFHHGHFGCKLKRSDDRGSTWTDVAVPAYPEPPPGRNDVDAWGRPWPWKLDRIWAFEAGGRDQPGWLWAGTLPGGLFLSKDRGQNWELVRGLWDHPDRSQWSGGGADLPGIHSVCVDPRDSQRVAVGVSCGGVWMTNDAGATWACTSHGMRAEFLPPEQQFDPIKQDPHLIVQCPGQPDYFWAQHHNGIFRSTNGGTLWTEVSNGPESSFGFGVAVHPTDGNTAWFVPGIKDELRYPPEGRVSVMRTRDGGQTYEALRSGLPQEHAYDLVYRHCLVIDSTGECLAFASTTGSMWVTENSGDSWSCVSNHLPPVYALRFDEGA
jgi:hypothetical protein